MSEANVNRSRWNVLSSFSGRRDQQSIPGECSTEQRVSNWASYNSWLISNKSTIASDSEGGMTSGEKSEECEKQTPSLSKIWFPPKTTKQPDSEIEDRLGWFTRVRNRGEGLELKKEERAYGDGCEMNESETIKEKS